jgi:peptide/nickel transport system permease protein
MFAMRDVETMFETPSSQGRSSSLLAGIWYRLWRNKMALAGLGIVVLLILMALFAPFIATHDPVKMNPSARFQPPSSDSFFGTDEYGRDLFSRVIYGSRISLMVGAISVSIALTVGTLLGLISGYYMGVVDAIISRLMDLMFAFPGLLLALLMLAVLGPGMDRLMLAVGIRYMPIYARLVRGVVLTEREKMYKEAAEVIGCSNARIIRVHILPNVVPTILVQTSLAMSFAILAEAGLSFLGLGTQPPTPSWGVMLSKGRNLLNFSPWLSIWPGLAIMAAIFGFNVLGDGLRDALDPRLKGS